MTINEICNDLQKSFRSKAQLLQFLVKENGVDYEQYKFDLGVNTTSAFLDWKIDELINEQYNEFKKNES